MIHTFIFFEFADTYLTRKGENGVIIHFPSKYKENVKTLSMRGLRKMKLNNEDIKRLKGMDKVVVHFNGVEVGSAIVIGQNLSSCELILSKYADKLKEVAENANTEYGSYLNTFIKEHTITYPYYWKTSIEIYSYEPKFPMKLSEFMEELLSGTGLPHGEYLVSFQDKPLFTIDSEQSLQMSIPVGMIDDCYVSQKSNIQYKNEEKEKQVSLQYVLSNPDKKYRVESKALDSAIAEFRKGTSICCEEFNEIINIILDSEYRDLGSINLLMGFYGLPSENAELYKSGKWYVKS